MQVVKHKAVSIDYVLKYDDGQVLDQSESGAPLWYLHGVGNIIPGLEAAMEGRAAGDEFQVSIAPVDAYGERDDGLCQTVSLDSFEGVDDLEIGMQFRVKTENEMEMIVSVIEISDESVTLDGNHALAGETLHFDVTVREVREATQEEIDHGHVHRPGDHAH